MLIAPKNNRGEIITKRTMNSKTFDMGNGERVCCSSPVVIHAPDDLVKYDAGKSFKWIDPGIMIIEKSGFYNVQAGWYTAKVDIKNISLSYISRTGAKLRMGLKNIGGSPPGKPRSVTVKNDYIIWSEVSPGIDILLQFRQDRVEWFKKIKTATAARTFEWRLIEDANNRDVFTDKSFGYDNNNKPLQATTTLSKPILSNGKVYKIFRESWDGSIIKRDFKTRIKSKLFSPVYPVMLDASITVNIVSNNDDGHEAGGSWLINGAAGQLIVYPGYYPGWRFLSIGIAQGATVSAATLVVNKLTNTAQTITTPIYGEAVDNAAVWFNYSLARPSTMTKTVASVTPTTTDWGFSGLITINVQSIVQEIINRAGWVSGNALRIAIAGATTGGIQYLDDYSKAGTPVVGQLNVTFASGAGNSITGNVTITHTVAAAMAFNQNPSISGNVTINNTVAASLAYNQNPSITGGVTVNNSIAAALIYNQNPVISGDVTINNNIAASLSYNQNPSIVGNITVNTAVAAAALVHLSGRTITGDVTVNNSVAAAMDYTFTRSLAGGVTLSTLIAAAMAYAKAKGINPTPGSPGGLLSATTDPAAGAINPSSLSSPGGINPTV